MARKPKPKPRKSAPKAEKPKLDESQLSKGDLRSLNALRKKYGDDLAEKWFAEHLSKSKSGEKGEPEDKDAKLIAETVATITNRTKFIPE